jgi:hypothetical protein
MTHHTLDAKDHDGSMSHLGQGTNPLSREVLAARSGVLCLPQ